MFFKKTSIMSLATVFLLAGCMSTSKSETPVAPEEKANNQESVSVNQENQKGEESNIAVSTLKAELAEQKTENERLKAQLKSQKSEKKAQPAKILNEKTVLGNAEWAYITASKENLRARIDSGAATSSINAVNLKQFERDGKKWVRFNLTHDKKSKEEIIETRVVRIATITQSSKPGVETLRPVVKLHIRIGDIAGYTEFSLTNRLHMEYPVLIGRTFLKDVALVDVGQDYIHPKYQAKSKK
jgi:hypothetical protein